MTIFKPVNMTNWSRQKENWIKLLHTEKDGQNMSSCSWLTGWLSVASSFSSFSVKLTEVELWRWRLWAGTLGSSEDQLASHQPRARSTRRRFGVWWLVLCSQVGKNRWTKWDRRVGWSIWCHVEEEEYWSPVGLKAEQLSFTREKQTGFPLC